MRYEQCTGKCPDRRVGSDGQHVVGGDQAEVADQRIAYPDTQLVYGYISVRGPDNPVGKRIVLFTDIRVLIGFVRYHKECFPVVNKPDVVVCDGKRADHHKTGTVRPATFVVNNRTFDILVEEMGNREDVLCVVEHGLFFPLMFMFSFFPLSFFVFGGLLSLIQFIILKFNLSIEKNMLYIAIIIIFFFFVIVSFS